MKRRKFLAVAGSTIVIAGVTYYFLSDKNNFVRTDIATNNGASIAIHSDEKAIIYLASLAPSGHNTQPWFVHYIEPFHWVIGSDKSRWLPAVDPTQRETILSIGAFLQNLEYAANNLGYHCEFTTLATNNQAENIVDVRLAKTSTIIQFDVEQIKQRRIIRSSYLSDLLTKDDSAFLIQTDQDAIHYIPNNSKEHLWLNEQTIAANKIQTFADDAQNELANWIRFSSKDAAAHLDGLTLAGMEIGGIPGWYLRNFYDKKDVMKKSFRDQSIDKVVKQVSESAGWIIITSRDNSVATLLETGKLFQRLLLKIRERNIAIHPMTQILEEASTNQMVHASLGINEPIQFILRVGYVKNYPMPVTLRRSVSSLLRF